MENNNIKKVRGIESLISTCRDVLDVSTPVLIGEAGTGKTYTIKENLAKDYDITIVKRMSGMTDELMLGIPNVDFEDNSFEFAKASFINTIKKNKDKKILLVLDEINRTRENLRPALFELTERMIDGEFYQNLHVIFAVNHGDNFDTNWDIFGDKALMSRMFLLEFTPNRNDIVEHFEKNGYNDVVLKIANRIDEFIDSKTTEEDEQTSNFRSWKKLSHVFNKHKVKTPREAASIGQRYTRYFFNKKMASRISNIISTMIRAEASVNIREVIKGTQEIPSEHKFEVLMSTKEFALNKDNVQFCLENQDGLLKILSSKKEVLVGWLQEAKKINLYTKSQLLGFVRSLDSETKRLLLEVLK